MGCAEVLGIPSEPEFVPSPSPTQALSTAPLDMNAEPLPSSSAPSQTPDELASAPHAGPNSDGVVPTENVAAVDDEVGGSAPDDPPRSPSPAGLDGGLPDGGDDVLAEPLPADDCQGEFERVPVDVVFIVDNSGSMVAADAGFEEALPGFAARLDNDLVDYRIILLTRHRQEDRSASDEASTSVCIAAPLGGVAACPSPQPGFGPRFFPYSTKIDSGDSLDRALTTFSAPDPFGFTSIGWSEWLRLDARKVFIEISDADSALPSGEFVSALASQAPEHFGADPHSPGFVFHAIIGLIQKVRALDVYLSDEPLESDVCSGAGSDPDNAGEVYQELSRSTGGLRQSICPANTMILRLLVLAGDVVRRSVVACPAPG
jgi:hypothetical protein